MLVSYKWLQSFFDDALPAPEEIADVLTFGAFEIESMEQKGDDAIFDIDVLPNRASDCLSHRGIAREISILTGIPLMRDPFENPPHLGAKLPNGGGLWVEVADSTRCPVYIAVLVKGVKIGPSPDWLRERLESIGQKSINNIVDATNYVMFEMGQPMHAFDANKLTEKEGIAIGVRAAKSGEKIKVLGGGDYELTEEMTVITDANADVPIAIAGVKGGAHAEVGESTKDVVIEAAKFNPTTTRKAAQALDLRTDSSKRFENEVPNDLPFYGMQEVVKLIVKIAGGELAGYAVHQARKSSAYKLGVSVEEINKTLGTELSEKDAEKVLKKLQFEYKKIDDPIAHVLALAPALEGKPYKYGASVSYDAPREFDCSSLVAWLFAQAGVSIPRVVIDQFVYGEPVEESDLQAGDVVFSVSNENSRKEHTFTLLADGKEYVHSGPMRESQEYMQGTEVGGGVSHNGIYLGSGKVIHASNKHGVTIEEYKKSEYFGQIVGYRRMVSLEPRFVVDVPFERLDLRIPADLIEEIGRVYGYKNITGKALPPAGNKPEQSAEYVAAEAMRAALTQKGYTEILTYSLTDRGDVSLANALASDKNHLRANLADAMGEKLDLNEKNAPLLGLYDAVRLFEVGRVFTAEGEKNHVCIGVRILFGKGKEKRLPAPSGARQVGAQEEIEEVLSELGVSAAVVDGVAEFVLPETVPEKHNGKAFSIAKNVSYTLISPYPFALRDIALWVDEGTSAEDVEEVIRAHAGDLLVRADLFDTFNKDGRTSYALHLVFQSYEKTLSDDEVNAHMKNVESAVQKKEWEVR